MEIFSDSLIVDIFVQSSESFQNVFIRPLRLSITLLCCHVRIFIFHGLYIETGIQGCRKGQEFCRNYNIAL